MGIAIFIRITPLYIGIAIFIRTTPLWVLLYLLGLLLIGLYLLGYGYCYIY